MKLQLRNQNKRNIHEKHAQMQSKTKDEKQTLRDRNKSNIQCESKSSKIKKTITSRAITKQDQHIHMNLHTANKLFNMKLQLRKQNKRTVHEKHAQMQSKTKDEKIHFELVNHQNIVILTAVFPSKEQDSNVPLPPLMNTAPPCVMKIHEIQDR